MRSRLILPKTPRQIKRMREAGRIVGHVLEEMERLVTPGVTTRELDYVADTLIREMGGTPSFKGYHGYPATICTSVNDEVVHGIPRKRVLRDGDIVSVDVGAIYDGYQGDAARTYVVGTVPERVLRLLAATEAALKAGIAAARTGARLSDISHAIEQCARREGLEVIREYGGHGIGESMHEPPQIWNWGEPGHGPLLRSGMTFALEPMFTLGGHATRVRDDGWTVATADGSYAAHFEHTIVVTDDGGEILTLNTYS